MEVYVKIPKFTKKIAEEICFKYLNKFSLKWMLVNGMTLIRKENGKTIYKITICLAPNESEERFLVQLDTFIHEIIHVFHDIHSLEQNEKVIKRKTRRFIRRYKEFTRVLFQQMLDKHNIKERCK